MPRRSTVGLAGAVLVVVACVLPAAARAQASPARPDRGAGGAPARPRGAGAGRPAARSADSARISGQAATPQLITVRPREPLDFDAQLLAPTFYDSTFWPSIFAPYGVVIPAAPRVGGEAAGARADSAAAPGADAARGAARPRVPRRPGARRTPDAPR